MSTRKLTSYSSTFTRTPHRVVNPTSIDALLQEIGKGGHKITFRATGNALHDQALGRGRVVELTSLPHDIVVEPRGVDVDGEPPRATLEATAWTTWECLVRAALRIPRAPDHWEGCWDVGADGEGGDGPDRCVWSAAPGDALPRCMPYVAPSSGWITLGGGLSGDTIWRGSTVFGKESQSVLWLDLAVYEGRGPERAPEVLRIMNPALPEARREALSAGSNVPYTPNRVHDAGLNARLFNAVIGGFGLLGPILRAKLVLLRLDEELRWDGFDLRIPGEPDALEPHDGSLTAEEEREVRVIDADDDLRDSDTMDLPRFPRARPSEIAKMVGADLPVKALTWMFESESEEQVFDTLLAHHEQHAPKGQTRGPLELPAETSEKTVMSFALFFPYGEGKARRTIVGNVAYGRPPPGRPPFEMWMRRTAQKYLPSALLLLPSKGLIAEKVAWKKAFSGPIAEGRRDDRLPRQNPLPEFALFMEGHSRGMRRVRDFPQTLQQTWVIPIGADAAPARATFVELLAAVRRACQRGTAKQRISVQICDVKIVPTSRNVLSSAPHREGVDAAVAVTLAVEDGRDYDLELDDDLADGRPPRKLPSAVFRELAEEFMKERPGRVRALVHLTKDVHVPGRVLRAMYSKPMEEFLAVKRLVDPDDRYDSEFFRQTLRFNPG